ncbi:unnamed protein product [Ceutorhynchus assimilis]|uniref:Cathepsin L n=1 Tax=Ceutorhynchus assimilis TaxID=467358 RepID=A0A9N9MUQ1_9CUCU|nr:unnamed protein product [Ceutorhynchus assimilis]
MIKTLCSIAFFFVIVNALGEAEQWKSYKANFKKIYKNSKVEQKRFAIFIDNLQIIETHNAKYEKNLTTYKMAINTFADLTREEFGQLLGFSAGSQANITRNNPVFQPSGAAVPDEINWIEKGAVTGVKDQGDCGSCWSFSATGTIEGQYFLKNKKLVSLSEQNLVDCSTGYGDDGCSGGLMDNAFKYTMDYGIMSEASYPYLGVDATCKYESNKVVAKVQSFVDIVVGSEDGLKSAVGTVGPVSVAVDASEFQFYGSGIMDSAYCNNGREYLDHGILAVGYGNENGVDYWLVKNSWGADWGENGYIRMSRNKDNQCGIATCASYAVL